MPHPASARGGMALILTLAAIVLAGGLALYLHSQAAAAARLEQTELRREQLRWAAAEAARAALRTLAADEDREVDHLGEEWALPHEATDEEGLSTRVVIEDAGRFFNWNNLGLGRRTAPVCREILLDLMTLCGDFQPVARVEALEDYIDADDTGPYEADFYRAANPPFRPPNRELWAPAELFRIHQFSPEMFRPRLPPPDGFSGNLAAATVVVPCRLDRPIPINVNTASREVLLAAAGLAEEDAVRAILALRQMEPFRSLGVLYAAQPALAAKCREILATASSCFRVRARASLQDLHCILSAWVWREKNGDLRILQWVVEEG